MLASKIICAIVGAFAALIEQTKDLKLRWPLKMSVDKCRECAGGGQT